MLCDVGSSFTRCNGWFARTARTCGRYMQPFCSTTAGCVGVSNVRSPRPSETKTTTSCRSPLPSVTTSWAYMGEACCLAQLGSADMLIALGFGTTPSNFTTPFRLAVVPLLGPGSPAFIAWGADIQIARVSATIETALFAFITTTLLKNFPNFECVNERPSMNGQFATSGHKESQTVRRVSEHFSVSALISGQEHGAILFPRPAADRRTRWLTRFGREFAQVESVTKCTIRSEPRFCIDGCRHLVVCRGEHARPQDQDNRNVFAEIC